MDKRLRTETRMMSFAHTFHQTPQGKQEKGKSTLHQEQWTWTSLPDAPAKWRQVAEPGGTASLQTLGFTVQQSTNSPIFIKMLLFWL